MQLHKNSQLASFFEPRGVAVIGSMREWGEGYTVIRNMLDFGFPGGIYPVSRSSAQVLGLKAYPTVNDINDAVDLAVVVTPAPTVLGLIEECGRKGITAVIVVTEGFAEASPEGAVLQRQLVETARRYGLRLLGPNTLGVLDTASGLVTGPYFHSGNKPPGGGIGYCSQTGLLTFGVYPIKDKAYPIDKMCDFGNKCDVNELDLLPYLANDPRIKVIVMHLEDIRDGQKFIEVAKLAVARKPVLILKPGSSEVGARAASSHTGSLAGDDRVYGNAFRQAGVIRLKTWQEFWEIPRTLSLQPLPIGNRIAIITATGGAGVLLTDTSVENGLAPAAFTASTLAHLEEISPRLARNPVDVGPLMSVLEAPFSIYDQVVPIVLADSNVDCAAIVCHLGPPIVKVFSELVHRLSSIAKPITIFGYGIDLHEMEHSARQLEAIGFPTYLDLESAARALGIGAAYSRIRARLETQA